MATQVVAGREVVRTSGSEVNLQRRDEGGGAN